MKDPDGHRMAWLLSFLDVPILLLSDSAFEAACKNGLLEATLLRLKNAKHPKSIFVYFQASFFFRKYKF
mgnify:CR=1 FL=1